MIKKILRGKPITKEIYANIKAKIEFQKVTPK